MARKVFFSFHFGRDSRRVAIVRNSPIIGGYAKPPFLDAAAWEQVERKGDVVLKNWIDNNMHGTSATIVLIGADTFKRKWVLYEIQRSLKTGNEIFGITLHDINDPFTGKDTAGKNPFDLIGENIRRQPAYSIPAFDWIHISGRVI